MQLLHLVLFSFSTAHFSFLSLFFGLLYTVIFVFSWLSFLSLFFSLFLHLSIPLSLSLPHYVSLSVSFSLFSLTLSLSVQLNLDALLFSALTIVIKYMVAMPPNHQQYLCFLKAIVRGREKEREGQRERGKE